MAKKKVTWDEVRTEFNELHRMTHDTNNYPLTAKAKKVMQKFEELHEQNTHAEFKIPSKEISDQAKKDYQNYLIRYHKYDYRGQGKKLLTLKEWIAKYE